MPTIDRYEDVAILHESANSTVFRAREPGAADRSVILKVLRQAHPSPEQIACYQREYEITRALDLAEVINVYRPFRLGSSYALALEDFGACSLASYMSAKPVSISRALSLGIRIAETIAKIHERDVIHKDINPTNIVYNASSDKLKLIDFGISTRLPENTSAWLSIDRLEGTPAYMSPEQTGRMNRKIDYRTDFYSFGAMLYEMLCGHPPFQAQGTTQLLHSHLVRTPPPVHELNSKVPRIASLIIDKLLAKSADERYSSGWGIANDLRRCAEILREPAQRDSVSFVPGYSDTSARFELPHKLYGRERETQTLLELYGQTSRGGTSFVLVSGYSGSGKTSLVQELHRPVTLTRGHYASGKCEKLRRIPYSALTQALADICRQLLMTSEHRLDRWRQRISSTLRADIQVLVGLVPELAGIVGPQPPAEDLAPAEANLRLRRLLVTFLRVLASAEHPLVLFLDDLQWADALTLDLIEHVVRCDDIEGLMIVGAYRDNEVDSLHPLIKACTALDHDQITIHRISVPDLAEHHINNLLCDTLRMTSSEVSSLAQLLVQRTGGNPFYVRQLLSALHQRGLLSAEKDRSDQPWSWNMAELEGLGFTDNVVDLMLERLSQLPEQGQVAVQLAALLGTQFDLQTLALVAQLSVQQAQQWLEPAIQAGYVLPLSKAIALEHPGGRLNLVNQHFRFLHDRVQQAGYTLCKASERAQLHSQIGRSLLSSLPASDHQERVFEIVDHLNKGLAPEGFEEIVERARLNLEAACRAKAATAFESAKQYITRAASFISEPFWVQEHSLALEILTEQVEIESACSNYELAERVAEVGLARTQDVFQAARMHRVLISQRTMLSQYQQAMDLGLEVLRTLGVEFPDKDLGGLIMADHQAILARLDAGGPACVLQLPECTDPESQIVISLLASIISSAYQAAPELMAALCTRVIRETFSRGLHHECVLGFSAYAILLGAMFKEYTVGYEVAQIALDIAERFESRLQRCRATNVMVAHVGHWARPFAVNEDLVRQGFQAGIEVGEQEYTSYLLAHQAVNCWVAGERIVDLQRRLDEYAEHIQRTKNEVSILEIQALQLVIGEVTEGASAARTEAELIRDALDAQIFLPVAQLWISKARFAYCTGKLAEAEAYLSSAEPFLQYIPGCSSLSDYHFFRGLTALSLSFETDESSSHSARYESFEESLAALEGSAQHCPQNFAHRLWLLKAEAARLNGERWPALEAYDRAITLAGEQQALHDLALGYYRASRFMASRGKRRLAEAYLQSAYRSFQEWGATAIASHLVRQHPELVTQPQQRTSAAPFQLNRTLDLETVIRASKEITNARTLDELLVRLIEIALENAGADRGVLVLQHQGELIVKASGQWLDQVEVELLSCRLEDFEDLSTRIVQYVARTRTALVLDDARAAVDFGDDPFVRHAESRSILSFPILNQGLLLAVLFMENRQVAGAFTRQRVDVLGMLMAPAAVALENAILKRSHEDSAFAYQVGGSLPAGSQSYVTRLADSDLHRAILAGRFCHVLCSRQMGKSSLRIQSMQRLQRAGVTCASIDLSLIGTAHVTPAQWYAGIIRALVSDLDLETRFDLSRWWKDNDALSPVSRLAVFIEEILLPSIPGRIVIFIDEVDSVLSLGFSFDDFFALIRGLYNLRAEKDAYGRLSIVLLGVISPAELVQSPTRTPFNISHRIRLEHFEASECRPLFTGLADKSDAERALQAILTWTNGQPFLTQKICQLLAEHETAPRPGQEEQWIAKTIKLNIIDNWEMNDEPVHFRSIRDRLLLSPLADELLSLYVRVLNQPAQLPATGSMPESELLIAGLVINEHGRLVVSNRIYEQVFDAGWVRAALNRIHSPQPDSADTYPLTARSLAATAPPRPITSNS